ncbi:MAG TPA: amidohydrolase family protein [Acidobacteriaceae bacterium]|nr:amidohydrolase family protein [Acidobacteriaceae bacterium]
MRNPVRPFLCFLFIVSLSLAARAQQTPIALTGTLVMPETVIEQGTVLVKDGRIVASGAHVTLPAGTRVVPTDGIIAPGLIDLHNHLSWNIFPRWKPIEEFGNRYDWQQKPVYKIQMTAPHDLIAKEGLECEAERYAEVKAITEGETSVTGSMHAPCVQHLTRNLDIDPELGPGLGKILYDVFPLQMSPEALAAADTALSAHPRGSLLIHLSEGAPHDAAAAREFVMLKGRGLLRPGVSLIHGVAITPEGFAEMAAAGVGLIWSPRSNVELYGDTANVAAAKAAGVQIALAPDWSPTGSDGLLGELKYASLWNQTQTPPPFSERDLVMMATTNAAALVNLSAEIGSLAPGHAADLIVLRKAGADSGHDAYWTVTHSSPQDLELVLIGGRALYGDAALVEPFGAANVETLQICGASKRLAAGATAFANTEQRLDLAMHRAGRFLAPLAECGY